MARGKRMIRTHEKCPLDRSHGLTTAFTIIVATQFAVPVMLDHFGWLGAAARPIDMMRLVGVGAIIAGVWLTAK